jgi:site-specific DNA recombinase
LIARCKRDGDHIAGIFREEGETATNMKRPAFEQMIARATDGTRSVDAIMVYSFSRAFRNQVEQELTIQTLRKHKIELISHADPLANDDTGDMFRKFIGIVNEYQLETSRSTMRTMKLMRSSATPTAASFPLVTNPSTPKSSATSRRRDSPSSRSKRRS